MRPWTPDPLGPAMTQARQRQRNPARTCGRSLRSIQQVGQNFELLDGACLLQSQQRSVNEPDVRHALDHARVDPAGERRPHVVDDQTGEFLVAVPLTRLS